MVIASSGPVKPKVCLVPFGYPDYGPRSGTRLTARAVRADHTRLASVEVRDE